MWNKSIALLSQAFRVDVRQLRTHLLRGAVAAGVLWMLAVIHLEMNAWSSPGLELCFGLTFSTMALLTLMGAFYFPSVITEEKEEQTLGLLRMAGVGSATLLIGKSIGRVGVILLLIAVSLPYWWLTVTLGGVTTSQVAAVALSLAAHLVLVSQVGTLCSVLFSTTGRACVASAIALGAMFFGPPILDEILGELRVIPRRSSLFQFVYELMAPFQLEAILRPGYAGGILTAQVWSNLLAGLALFALSWILLDRLNTYDQTAGPESRVFKKLRQLLPNLTRRRRKPRRAPEGPVGAAISWKDFRLFGGGYRWWIYRSLGFLPVAFLFTFDGWGTFHKRLGVGFIIVTFWWFIAEVVFQSGRLFQRELKEETWDSLRMLPISTGALCRRKIVGILPVLVPTLAFFSLGMLLEEGLFREITREFDRHPILSSMLTLYIISAAIMAVYITCYFGIQVNPWLGTVIAAALFGFIVFSTFFCCLEVFDLDSMDEIGFTFFGGMLLNIACSIGFHIPISRALNGVGRA